MSLYMSTDEQIATLLTKGVEQILPSADFLRSKLLSGQKLKVYAGFDPTAPTLHIGNAIHLRKLRQFQDLGHQVIFLVGDFTARIGDPDKLAVRKPLSPKEIKTNMSLYKKQASKFISFSGRNAAKIKYNNKWLSKLRFSDLISIASLLTVDQILKRDMFVRRGQEEKPIYLHEFFYPLMQGYDSVAMDIDGEVGGNDQLFNMMTGRTLLKQMKNKEKFVITGKLLVDSEGKKMGKTEGNMVTLEDAPEDIYGKVMSWADSMLSIGFELCTDLNKDESENIITGNPRDAKMRLAFEITKSVHGEKLASKAQEVFIKTFQKKEIPTDIETVQLNGSTLQEILTSKSLVESNSELRRLVESGAVTLLEKEKVVSVDDIKKIPEKGTYKIGKNRFIKIV